MSACVMYSCKVQLCMGTCIMSYYKAFTCMSAHVIYPCNVCAFLYNVLMQNPSTPIPHHRRMCTRIYPLPTYTQPLIPTYPRAHVPPFPHTLVPTYPRTHVPSYPRTLAPTYPRTHVSTLPRTHVPPFPRTPDPPYPPDPPSKRGLSLPSFVSSSVIGWDVRGCRRVYRQPRRCCHQNKHEWKPHEQEEES